MNGLVAVRDASKRRPIQPTNKISGKKENNVFHDGYLLGENGEKVHVCQKTISRDPKHRPGPVYEMVS